MSSIGSRLAAASSSNPQFGAGYPQSQQYTPPQQQNSNGYKQQPQQQQQNYSSPQVGYGNAGSTSSGYQNNSGIIPPHQITPNRMVVNNARLDSTDRV